MFNNSIVNITSIGKHLGMVFDLKLKSDSHLRKFSVLFASKKPFETDEKYFLFHLKSSFRSQDI